MVVASNLEVAIAEAMAILEDVAADAPHTNVLAITIQRGIGEGKETGRASIDDFCWKVK